MSDSSAVACAYLGFSRLCSKTRSYPLKLVLLLSMFLPTPGLSSESSSEPNTHDWSTLGNLPTSEIPCSDNLSPVHFQNTDSYSLENAYLSLNASWLSHNRSLENKHAQLLNWGFKRFKELPSEDFGTRGYVADHGEFILIAFRGTESRKDLFSNALFYQSEAPKYLGAKGAWMHQGMKNIYSGLRKEMNEILVEFDGKNKPIYLAGHSLGGSLAVIAALDLANSGADIKSVYTFGMPKIGNSILGHKVRSVLGNKYFRINIESDITSRVPPAKETADDFSNIISESNPKLRNNLKTLVNSINYATETGSLQLLGKNGDLSPLGSGELDFEHRYWKKISNVLSDRDDLQGVIEFVASRFTDHAPNIYICAMSKNFITSK